MKRWEDKTNIVQMLCDVKKRQRDEHSYRVRKNVYKRRLVNYEHI